VKAISLHNTVAEMLAKQLTADRCFYPMEVVVQCKQLHAKAPVVGCPVCFVTLCHAQALVDFCHALLLGLSKEGAALGEELGGEARRVLEDFNNLPSKVLAQVTNGAGSGGVQ
jgi:hypothetical protein